jgi:hypothetical protein
MKKAAPTSGVDECLTAAERIRRKRKATTLSSTSLLNSNHRVALYSKQSCCSGTSTAQSPSNIETIHEKTDDIDEEIQRLEQELQALDDDEGDDDIDSVDSNDDDDDETSLPIKNGVLSISESANSKIERLPAHCLPAVPRKSAAANHSKRQRGDTTSEIAVSNGFKSAVQEIIRSYQPRSAEKLPFYCRFCSTQYSNETEFVLHQSLPEHKQRVILDQKASYCKLCRKQLTSPAQLRDHIQSKPHKERLNYVQSKSTREPRQQSGNQSGQNQRQHQPNVHSNRNQN